MTSEELSKALWAKDELIRESERKRAELMERIDRVTASLEESNRNMAQMTATLNSVISDLSRQLAEANKARLKAEARRAELIKEISAGKKQKATADKDRVGSWSQRLKVNAASERPSRQRKIVK